MSWKHPTESVFEPVNLETCLPDNYNALAILALGCLPESLVNTLAQVMGDKNKFVHSEFTLLNGVAVRFAFSWYSPRHQHITRRENLYTRLEE